MEPDDCPPWIESGNAFRLIIKVAKYSLADYDGVVEMDGQEHELWLDRSVGYSLAQFHEDMATKMIWGPSQALAIWVLDSETVGSEWRIRRDEHWQQVIKDRWEVRMAYIAMEATEAAARAANREAPVEPLPIEFQLVAPPTPSGPSTKRRLLLGASEPVPEGEQQVVEAVPKKMTPKRKQLSSKIKKK